MNIQTCRACQTTGGLICFLDGKGAGDGLGIFFVGGLPVAHALIVFIGQDNGAYLLAVTARCTLGFVDISGIFSDGNLKISPGPLHVLDFSTGNQINVQMPADLDQFR